MKKGTIKKISCILLILANLFLLAACEKKSVPPTIVVGREWNHQVNRVADTASSFTLKDPVVFELVSETHFEFTEMECIVYEGTIKNRGPENGAVKLKPLRIKILMLLEAKLERADSCQQKNYFG